MQPFTFPTTVSAREIQRGYKKVFDTVKKTKKPIVVMANNTPQAAIISMDILEEYNRIKEDQELFALIDEIRARNTEKTIEEVEKDATEAVEEVRKKIYEKAFGSP
ncbi:MAG: type II toxin-antitoxin system Phd/YefM family antitoxin [Patescibacteria group bacterium]